MGPSYICQVVNNQNQCSNLSTWEKIKHLPGALYSSVAGLATTVVAPVQKIGNEANRAAQAAVDLTTKSAEATRRSVETASNMVDTAKSAVNTVDEATTTVIETLDYTTQAMKDTREFVSNYNINPCADSIRKAEEAKRTKSWWRQTVYGSPEEARALCKRLYPDHQW